MKLPKLYRPVRVKFWSLRIGLGQNYGMVEYDKEITRKCRRALNPDGSWKWQIVLEHINQWKWDYSLEQDMEILNNYGSELEFELANHGI